MVGVNSKNNKPMFFWTKNTKRWNGWTFCFFLHTHGMIMLGLGCEINVSDFFPPVMVCGSRLAMKLPSGSSQRWTIANHIVMVLEPVNFWPLTFGHFFESSLVWNLLLFIIQGLQTNHFRDHKPLRIPLVRFATPPKTEPHSSPTAATSPASTLGSTSRIWGSSVARTLSDEGPPYFAKLVCT